MKCNLNALNTSANWIHNKHLIWDEYEIWWILAKQRKRLVKALSKVRTISENCSMKRELIL